MITHTHKPPRAARGKPEADRAQKSSTVRREGLRPTAAESDRGRSALPGELRMI